jgi:hypothetical protein
MDKGNAEIVFIKAQIFYKKKKFSIYEIQKKIKKIKKKKKKS